MRRMRIVKVSPRPPGASVLPSADAGTRLESFTRTILTGAVAVLVAGCQENRDVVSPGVQRTAPLMAPPGRIHADVRVFDNAIDLGGGGRATWEAKINERGEVAGEWSNDPVTGHADQVMFYSPGGDIRSIGAPAGCGSPWISALGDGGHIVGYVSCPIVLGSGQTTSYTTGYRWTAGSGFELLRVAPGFFAAPTSVAYAVNSSGMTAGMSPELFCCAGWGLVSRWGPGSSLPQTSPRPSDRVLYYVSGPMFINEAGTIAGVISWSTNGFDYRTSVYSWSAGEASLRELFVVDGQGAAIVSGLNDNGTIVGTVGNHVYRWSASGSQDLGTPFPASASRPAVVGVANDETIAGYGSSSGSILNRGFRWTPSAGFTTLPTVPANAETYVSGISRSGIITGSLDYGTASSERAFRFSPTTGFQDLGSFPEAGARTTRGSNVNSRGDVVGFWFYPHSWAIWPGAPVNRAPAAVIGDLPSIDEGSSTVFDASESSDPDGNPLSFTWNFGDGSVAGGSSPTHTYADNGTFSVSLTATDGKLSTTTTKSVTVWNVAPRVTASAPAQVAANAVFTLSAIGIDDPSPEDIAAGLTLAFDCGSGLGAFSSATTTQCTAPAFGRRTLAVSIRDKDSGAGASTVTVSAVNDMDVQPATISLTATGTISVYLYSTSGFDARQTSAATVRLQVAGSGLPGASVALRGTAPMTSVGDYNNDGRPDRLFVFTRAAVQNAGLATTRTTLQLVDESGVIRFFAMDRTPPMIAP
jgi:PKD repeat protein